MDCLGPFRQRIETVLAKRRRDNGSMVLYDITSVYFQGTHCPLARFGHNRDGKSGTIWIVAGLVYNENGYPIAVTVYDGITADGMTVPEQIEKEKNNSVFSI